MGWLRALHSSVVEPQHEELPNADHVHAANNKIKRKEDANCVSHIDTLPATQEKRQPLAFVYTDMPDNDLPFISAAELAVLSGHHKTTNNSNNNQNDGTGRLYLAIDDIVYDCTQFVHDHPGGPRVIESFRGQDCSWQFWRFHSGENMEEWGRPLRVARTKGVKNRWKERPRFVGLRRFGAAEDGDGGW